MTIGTLFNWTAGNLDGPSTTADTIVPGASAFQMTGGTNKFLFHRTLTNNSTTAVNWTGSNLYTGYGAIFNNGVGATLNMNGDQDLVYYTGAQTTFNNMGSFAKTGGSADGYIDTTINNSGSIAANSGILQLYRDGTETGPFTIANGASLEFRPYNTFNLSSSATVTGAAGSTVRFAQSGTTTLNGAYNVPTTEISGSTNNFEAATTLGTLSVSGGTATFDVDTTPATVNLSGGVLQGAGDMTIGTLFNWTGGTLDGPGTTADTIVPAASAFQMTGGTNKFLFHRTLTNNSTTAVNWTGSNLYTGYGAVFNNSAGATINANGDQDLVYYTGAAPQFNNTGTFAKTGGTDLTEVSVPLDNDASFQVNAGTLYLSGGSGASTSDGSFTSAAGKVLQFAGGTSNLGASSSVTGAGTVRFSGGTTNVGGDYNVPALTDVTGGTVNFNLSSFFDTSPATTGTMTQSGGTVGGDDTLNITGSFTWSGGTQTGTGQTVILPAASMLLNGTTKVLSGLRTLDNQGTTTWTDQSALNVGGGTVSGGTIVNEGVWNMGDGESINANGGQMEFQNLAGSVVNKITTPGGQAVNWSAEDGPGSTDGGIVASIPGWSRTSNFTVVQYGSPGFPTVAQAPPGAGTNFFAGGPTTALSTLTQNIDISPYAGAIDGGDFTSMLDGYLGGCGAENDNMTVRAVFLSGATELGNLTLAPVLATDRGNTTGFVFRSGQSTVPPGTRTVRLEQTATRVSTGGACGTNYNNAYSDKINIQFRDSNAYIGSSYDQHSVRQRFDRVRGWRPPPARDVESRRRWGELEHRLVRR